MISPTGLTQILDAPIGHEVGWAVWAWGGGSWGGLCSSTELGSNPSGWCFLGLQKSLIILPRASETAAVAPPVTSLRKAFEREQRAVRRTGESPGEGGGGDQAPGSWRHLPARAPASPHLRGQVRPLGGARPAARVCVSLV